MAQDRDGRPAGTVLVRREPSAELRRDAEHAEVVPRDAKGVHPLGDVASEQIESHGSGRRHVLKHGTVFFPKPELAVPDVPHAQLAPGGPRELDDAIGLGVRQWPPQHAVRDAEHGCVGTDPQREREDHDGGEAGALRELAEGVTQIVQHPGESSIGLALGYRVSGPHTLPTRERPIPACNANRVPRTPSDLTHYYTASYGSCQLTRRSPSVRTWDCVVPDAGNHGARRVDDLLIRGSHVGRAFGTGSPRPPAFAQK
jgi:hypothetical protein